MINRLNTINQKITKSTLQIQKILNKMIPSNGSIPSYFKTRSLSKYNNKQDKQKYENQNQDSPLRNSNIETNASTKYMQSRQRFFNVNANGHGHGSNDYDKNEKHNGYNGFNGSNSHDKKYFVHIQEQEQDNQQKIKNNSIKINRAENKNRNQILNNTKFSIGKQIYPRSSSNINININDKLFNLTKIDKKFNEQQKLPQKIIDIDHNYILEHAINRQVLTSTSKPQQIFNYFYQFSYIFKKPLIKKFKNCIYFGQSPQNSQNSKNKSSKYIGFLYFYTLKIYYGYFEQEHKNGLGVQINLKNKIIYKGTFNRGHKIGKFNVYCKDVKYQGYLNKNKFHGYGKLQTPISIYIGQFQNGMRHGQGQEYFIQNGLKFKGRFQMNKFCNTTHEGRGSNSNNINSKVQKNIHTKQALKRIQPIQISKINNIFQYSFHDSSEDQNFIEQNSCTKLRKQISNKINNSYKISKISRIKNNKINKNNPQNQQMQQASDDDPLPSPFRKIFNNNNK